MKRLHVQVSCICEAQFGKIMFAHEVMQIQLARKQNQGAQQLMKDCIIPSFYTVQAAGNVNHLTADFYH